jgi:hypothetical protein
MGKFWTSRLSLQELCDWLGEARLENLGDARMDAGRESHAVSTSSNRSYIYNYVERARREWRA